MIPANDPRPPIITAIEPRPLFLFPLPRSNPDPFSFFPFSRDLRLLSEKFYGRPDRLGVRLTRLPPQKLGAARTIQFDIRGLSSRCTREAVRCNRCFPPDLCRLGRHTD